MIRRILLGTTLLLLTPAVALSQIRVPAQSLPGVSIGGAPLVLAEHGDPALAVPPLGGLAALIVYDIATASGSARRWNMEHSESPVSPSFATGMSIAWTIVPVAGGAALASSGIDEGVFLGVAGVALGPSAGHIYSGRVGRGLTTAGIRLVLGLLAGSALLAAS